MRNQSCSGLAHSIRLAWVTEKGRVRWAGYVEHMRQSEFHTHLFVPNFKRRDEMCNLWVSEKLILLLLLLLLLLLFLEKQRARKWIELNVLTIKSAEGLLWARLSLTRTKLKQHGKSWFQTSAVLWILYSIFLGDSPASEFYVPTFRNNVFHHHRTCGQDLWKWNRQCVRKCLHIKFRSWGITQKKEQKIGITSQYSI